MDGEQIPEALKRRLAIEKPVAVDGEEPDLRLKAAGGQALEEFFEDAAYERKLRADRASGCRRGLRRF